MNKIKKTLKDLEGIDHLLTRFNPDVKHINDLDILVKRNDFQKLAKLLIKRGYERQSHDQALGGRIKGCQVNFIKPNRIKIDLHQDFTWRKWRYLDINLVWKSRVRNTPSKPVDTFLVLINILFEKTYLDSDDFLFVQKNKAKILNNNHLSKQAYDYGWGKSYKKLVDWLDKLKGRKYISPIFLPMSLVLYSTLEKYRFEKKIDMISFAYYIFFRSRYLIAKRLPYD